MGFVFSVLYLVLLLFMVFLLTRLVLSWVQQFAREWKPKGIVLILAEVTYTVTDPPLKAVRRILPPLRIGAVSLDLGFIVVFIATTLAMALIAPFTL